MARVYVGDLPFSTTEGELRELFSRRGTFESVSLPVDPETGRPLRVNEAGDEPRSGGGARSDGGGGRRF